MAYVYFEMHYDDNIRSRNPQRIDEGMGEPQAPYMGGGEETLGFEDNSTWRFTLYFTEGYELGTVTISGSTDAKISNKTSTTFDLYTGTTNCSITVTSKPIEGGGDTMTFKHYFKGAKIGTGNIAFRDFAPVPTLPQVENVTVDGTTLSWDEVENATSYDIYADGTLIGNTDGGGAVV